MEISQCDRIQTIQKASQKTNKDKIETTKIWKMVRQIDNMPVLIHKCLTEKKQKKIQHTQSG